MEKSSNYTEEKLFSYIDGTMDAKETLFFEQAINHSPSLRKCVEEQQLMETMLKNVQIEDPSQAFVQNVMNKLNETYSLQTLSIKRAIVLLSGVLVLSLLITFLTTQSDFFSISKTINLQKELGVLSSYIKQPLPSIIINSKLILNGIILINLALGFLILDRAILRPYFEGRMKHGIVFKKNNDSFLDFDIPTLKNCE